MPSQNPNLKKEIFLKKKKKKTNQRVSEQLGGRWCREVRGVVEGDSERVREKP